MVTASGSGVAESGSPKAKKKRRRAKEPRPKKLTRLALEFQPDAVEIERRSIPGGARWTLYTIIAIIIASVTWASLTKVDRIVTADGKLITTVTPVIVQASEQSPVKTVYCRFGDVVKRGEILAELDTSFPESELRRIDKDLRASTAAIDRITAELEDRVYEVDDDANLEEIRQSALYEARAASKAANISDIDHQVQQITASLARNDGLISLYADHQALLQGEVERLEEQRNSLIATAQELATKRDALFNSKLQSRERELQQEELVAQREGLYKRKDAFLSDWRKELIQELTELESKRIELIEQRTKTEIMLNRSVLRVPPDLPHEEYMVTEAADRTSESVVQTGEAVFKLIPLNSPLEVEVMIKGKDIGNRFDGPVRVKFNAFPYQKYGFAEGIVRAISEESVVQNQQSPQDRQTPQQAVSPESGTFRAIIRLEEGWQEEMDLPSEAKFYPGMTVASEINVGRRRVIDYFLYPIFRNLDKSIREP